MGDKALSFLSLARKAGRAELGEEPVGEASRAGRACLIGVASDASDHTWRRACSFAAGTGQQVVRLPFSKEELGRAVGRESLALAAVTDPGLALALLESLPDSGGCQAAIQALAEKNRKLKKRREEDKAHWKNVRKGKK